MSEEMRDVDYLAEATEKEWRNEQAIDEAYQRGLKEGEAYGAADLNNAYNQGRADREKELMQGEQDGFMAYHERHGLDKTSFRGKESLVAKFMDDITRPVEAHPLDMGWQIVPVKIIKMEKV